MSNLFSRTRPLVGALLSRISPAAILRRVVTVIIDPVERHSGRAWPHVLQKRIKAIRPSFAHGYAAVSVPLARMVIRVETTSLSLCPRYIFAGLVSPLLDAVACVSMLQRSRVTNQNLSGAAALTALRPILQCLGAYSLDNPATVAATHPCGVSLDAGRGSPQHFIESKSFAWRISDPLAHDGILSRWSPVAWWRFAVVSLIEQPKEPK